MACSHLTLDFTQFLWASLFIKIPFYCTVLVGGQNSSGLVRHAFARLGRRVGLFAAFPYGNFDIVIFDIDFDRHVDRFRAHFSSSMPSVCDMSFSTKSADSGLDADWCLQSNVMPDSRLFLLPQAKTRSAAGVC